MYCVWFVCMWERSTMMVVWSDAIFFSTIEFMRVKMSSIRSSLRKSSPPFTRNRWCPPESKVKTWTHVSMFTHKYDVCLPPLPSKPIRLGFRMDAMTRRDLSMVASSSCLDVQNEWKIYEIYDCMHAGNYSIKHMYSRCDYT